jgi:integrase
MNQELNDAELEEVLTFVDRKRGTTGLRDKLWLLLGHDHGLAPKEIANVHAEDFYDVTGRLSDVLQVTARGRSGKQPRMVTLTPRGRTLLIEYLEQEQITYGALFQSTPTAIKVQLWKVYQGAGFPGASAYSGRTSFGFRAGRTAKAVNRSLRDLAALMGLAHLESARKYEDDELQAKLQKAITARKNTDR